MFTWRIHAKYDRNSKFLWIYLIKTIAELYKQLNLCTITPGEAFAWAIYKSIKILSNTSLWIVLLARHSRTSLQKSGGLATMPPLLNLEPMQTMSFDEGISEQSRVKGWGRRCQETTLLWGGWTTDVWLWLWLWLNATSIDTTLKSYCNKTKNIHIHYPFLWIYNGFI